MNPSGFLFECFTAVQQGKYAKSLSNCIFTLVGFPSLSVRATEKKWTGTENTFLI